MLDWYHASEHDWECGKALHKHPETRQAWIDAALRLKSEEGGEGLLNWLLAQRSTLRGRRRQSLDAAWMSSADCLTVIEIMP